MRRAAARSPARRLPAPSARRSGSSGAGRGSGRGSRRRRRAARRRGRRSRARPASGRGDRPQRPARLQRRSLLEPQRLGAVESAGARASRRAGGGRGCRGRSGPRRRRSPRRARRRTGAASSSASPSGRSRSSTTSPSRTMRSAPCAASSSGSRKRSRRSRSLLGAGAEVEVGDDQRFASAPNPRSRVARDRLARSVSGHGVPQRSRSRTRRPARPLATVPELGADDVAAMVATARAAQPGWEALGFEARAEVLLAARTWMVANAERVVQTICAETGRPADETQFAELSYGLSALEFWAKQAPAYLADEEIESASPFVRGRRLMVRYAPVGVVGVIGPWNYPLNNSFGDCIPALAAGNAVVLKPSEVTPLTSLLMAEMLADVRAARRRLPGRHRPRRDRRGARRRGRLRDVHRLGRDRQEGDGAGRADADPGQPRARRQGPDDRPRRRRPRARRQRRRLLRDQQLGPGLHLGRAHLRRGAGPRRVPRAAHREGRGPAPGPAGRARLGRRRRDHLPAADRPDRGPRPRRRRQGRAGGHRAGRGARARGASSSRRCSPTSTTRCAA